MVQGETSIAAEVLHSLPYMHKKDDGSFWQHLHAYYSSHDTGFAEINPQVGSKILDFEYPLRAGMGTMYYNE